MKQGITITNKNIERIIKKALGTFPAGFYFRFWTPFGIIEYKEKNLIGNKESLEYLNEYYGIKTGHLERMIASLWLTKKTTCAEKKKGI